ncbi:hypothetical protein [Streptomyces sp. BPTC-684]|uniref:hypothetical protein n=1 Tax=Streptomyces sp. BPTC-684 TaxID=3043734 RepID=UPI0024B0A200|nr:hypothetical protein [Streptomyces sp. BPTC-684]WHM41124.1 hypothetical protein QIY60_32545 [Streptomyces sp. BPTC-684]
MGIDALGLVEHVTIGGQKVTLAFPDLGSGGELTAALDGYGKPIPQQMATFSEGRWGYRSSSRLCYVSRASAVCLLQPQEKMSDAADFNALSEAFPRWFRILQEWAAVWSGEPLRDFDDAHSSAIHIPAGDQHMTGSGALMGTVFIGAQPLNRSQLAGALRRASCQEHLPVEHRMLLSAKSAELGGDLRRAVIDAGTAVEVALGAYITDHLSKKRLPADFITEAIKSANGMVALHGLCTNLGAELEVSKNRLRAELAEIRNPAAHTGKIPTAAEARRARTHAETLVRALRPIPQS